MTAIATNETTIPIPKVPDKKTPASSTPSRIAKIAASMENKEQPLLSSSGLSATSANNTSRRFCGTALVAPHVLGWTHSDFYPGFPNSATLQMLGFSTGMNALSAVHRFRQAIPELKRSAEIGDQRGKVKKIRDIASTIPLFGQGVGYSTQRASYIGSMVHPNNSGWAQAASLTRAIGGGAKTASYTLNALGEFLEHPGKVVGESFLTEFLSKETDIEKMAYLKHRFASFDKKKVDKEVGGKTEVDFKEAGLKSLRPAIQRNIELLKKHDKIPATFQTTANNLNQFATNFFGEENIINHGKEVLTNNLIAKRKQQLIHELGGSKEFKAIEAAVKDPKKTAEEVNKVVIDNITAAKGIRNKRMAMYVSGAILVALMQVFTEGIGATLAGVGYAIVSLCEAYFAFQKIQEVKGQKSMPGLYDKLMPITSMIVSIGSVITSFALSEVFGLGLQALIIGTAVASLLVSMNVYHLHCINKQKNNYIEDLQNKKTINLQEFEYLVRNLPINKIIIHGNPFLNLSTEERSGLAKHFWNLDGKNSREWLQAAIKLRYAEIERESLWGEEELKAQIAAQPRQLQNSPTQENR